MTTSATRTLTCRWIVPVVGDPIAGGWVRLRGNEIIEVGASSPPSAAEDLGDVAMLPGLVNAHTHLEFSDLATPIGEPGVTLAAWIGMVIGQRSASTPQGKHDAIRRGIDESIRHGVRLIGDIATPPCDYGVLQTDAPEIVSFAEVIGLSAPRSDQRYAAAIEHLRTIHQAAVSAHAPYSTTRETIQRCVDLSIARNRPLAMHVAESPAERELLVHGRGVFADSLREIGVWQDSLFPWDDRPFESLIGLLARSPSALLIHGNDLSDEEIDVLKQHPNITVVYCPRTHAFFGYDDHPVGKLIAANVPVAIGTDSRASNPDLNVWRDVQHVLNHRPDIDPADVIAMATATGADALMRPDVGRIAAGCRPGLITVATEASTLAGLYESLASGPAIPLRWG